MFSFMAETFWPFYKNFQGFTYCSIFKVLCCSCLAQRQLSKFITTLSVCQEFFKLFSKFLSAFSILELQAQKEGFEPSRRY